jgi:hypothetical protein
MFISVSVNGLDLGVAFADDFFSKFGNHDGHYIVGLVAEAHLVRRLRQIGYDVRLVLSHNVEIREIRRGDFVYECVGDYGEVIKDMPEELRRVFREFCEEGVNIRVGCDGNVPVFLEGNPLFKMSVKGVIEHFISMSKSRLFGPLIMFYSDLEPLIAALGDEIESMLLFSCGIEIYDGDLYLRKFDRESSNPTRSRIMNPEQVLDEIEKVFERNGIYLEREFELGLEISNRKTLEEGLKNLAPRIEAGAVT